MTISRYETRIIRKNNNVLYKTHFDTRSVKFINQYATPNLKYPTLEQYSELTIQQHIWKLGDRYYKYADEYYNDPKLWWVIAWFNQKPTENHMAIGDMVYIPLPLDKILKFFGV